MRTCHLAVVIVHTNYILSTELVALTKPCEFRAQHVLLHTGAGGCVVTHSPLTPTARVQLPVVLSSLTQAIILSWVGDMCSK